MNEFYSEILQKITAAENEGIYVVCDMRELLRIDGIYYLPEGH